VLAVILMLVFTLINIAGVNWLAESNKATVIWKTAVPVLTIIVLIAVSFHGSNFTTSPRAAASLRSAHTASSRRSH